MQLLRIKLFQETACYQKPFAFKVSETFPLAPFSTIKGMLHAVLGATQYIPMNLSIQGQSESMIIDYASRFMYKKAQVPVPVNVSGLGIDLEYGDITTMPMYQHLLYNVEHVIHIEADPEVLQQLHDRLLEPKETLSLGRWEDLVRIDEVQFVDVQEAEEVDLPLNVFLSYEQFQTHKEWNDDRAVYETHRLPRKYEIRNGKRSWDYIQAVLFHKGATVEGELLSDGTYPIYLLKG